MTNPIKKITHIYHAAFNEEISSSDIRLYHIDDSPNEGDTIDEAEVDWPEIGINRTEWDKWEPERQIEVILHELAHINQEPEQDDHDYSFYARLQQLTGQALENKDILQEAFHEDLDFNKIRSHLIDSVNKHTTEPEMDLHQTRLFLKHSLPHEE